MEQTSTCDICKNETSFCSIGMSCKHSICNSCLHQLILFNFQKFLQSNEDEAFQIRCVVCDIGEYSITLTNLNEFLSSIEAPKQENKICICDKNQNVEYNCLKCEWEMCKDWYLTHCDIRNFNSHEVSSLLLHSNFEMCLHHKSEKIKKFCNACKMPICSICMKAEHSIHNIINIYGFNKNRIQEIKKRSKLPGSNFQDFKD